MVAKKSCNLSEQQTYLPQESESWTSSASSDEHLPKCDL